jgi:hypothetical protein
MKGFRICGDLFTFPLDIVAYSLKARTVESQQPAVTRQRPVNKRGMVFSVQSVQMSAQETVEYIVQSLIDNCTATEERCFLCSPCRRCIMTWVACYLLHVGFLLCLLFAPEDGSDVPPEIRPTFSGRHRLLSQKIRIYLSLANAMRTSNATSLILVIDYVT